MERKKLANSLDASKELDDPPSSANISDLNNDCLILIFQQLNILDRVRLERVCKRWRALLKESWHNVNFLDFDNKDWGFKEKKDLPNLSTRDFKKVLSRCGQYVTDIELHESQEISGPNVLSTISQYCPNIKDIFAPDVTFNPASLRNLAKRCSKIEYLTLENCTSECDEELALLFSRNRKLKMLQIFYNPKVTGECLSALNADKIEFIRFTECDNLSMKNFGVLQNFKKLNTLEIDCFSTSDMDAAEKLSECFRNLIKFALHHNRPIFPFTAIQIAKLNNIEILDLSYNNSVSDDLLVTVSNNCKSLIKVNINSCKAVTNRGLSAILSLPSLEILQAEGLRNVDDSVFGCSPELKLLNSSDCAKMKNEGIARLIKNSHKIEDIYLCKCKEISNVLIRDAIRYTKKRQNGIALNIHVSKCKVKLDEITDIPPLLKVDILDHRFLLFPFWDD